MSSGRPPTIPTPAGGVSIADMLRMAVDVYGEIVEAQLKIAEVHWKAGGLETRTAIEDVIRTMGEETLQAFLRRMQVGPRGDA